MHSFLFAPQRTSATAKAWSWSPGNSSRDVAEEMTGSPKFLGNPNCPFAHVPHRRRQDRLHQTSTVQAAWPLVIEWQRLLRKVFRRSIAWLSDWLSTLRDADYSHTTQDSLPVAGQALLDGLSTRTVPLKGFRVVDYISSSSPKLGLAQRACHLSINALFAPRTAECPSIRRAGGR